MKQQERSSSHFVCLNSREALPRTRTGSTIANQMSRSGSSVAANYRALCRSRSRADFINKRALSKKKLMKTAFWLENDPICRSVNNTQTQPLLNEANELIAIFVASRKTAISRSS